MNKDVQRLKAKWMVCPECGREAPHPTMPSTHRDDQIDWTCNVCLHGHIARLKRLVAALTGERDE